MTRTFQPAYPHEADAFMDRFCDGCAHDSPRRPCPILRRAMTTDSTDPDYPAEWIVDDDAGPLCTAFTVPGSEAPAVFRASELLADAEVAL